MPTRPQRNLTAVATQLARALSSDDGLRASRLLSRLWAEPAPQPAQSDRDAIERIGIWNRTLDGDRIVYDRGTHEPTRLWADVQRIEPKQDGATRVLLLGESVARGNDYAPHYSPALVLQSILRACGLPRAEVIDLSRLGIGASQLLETARAGLALAPDAIVVFAGNNWSFLKSTPDDKLPSATLAAREFWRELRHTWEQLMSRASEIVATSLGELSREKRIPVVFLVPEFNLLDWRTTEPDTPLLDTADVARWCELRSTTAAALSCGDHAAAESAARAMLELDGGTMAATFDGLLAGRPDLAPAQRRLLLEQARDAGLGTLREYSPRCEKPIQESLRRCLPKNDVGMVDLPARFADYLRGALPGRNLFLDFVHLNSTGIRLSMALAAQWLLPRLTQQAPVPVATLLDEAPEPASRIAAVANLQAAYVNWAWGQDAEIQRHYLQAVLTHPAGADLLRDFLEYLTGAGLSGTCRAFRRLRASLGATAAYALPVLAVDRNKRGELGFVRNAIATVGNGRAELLSALTGRLQTAHGVTERGTDLLERYYRMEPVLDFFGGTLLGDGRPRAYHRAFTPKSAFFFVSDARTPLSLTLTCRTPEETAPDAQVAVHLNGRCVLRLPAASEWQSGTVTIDPSWITKGANDVVVHWPQPLTPWRDRLDRSLASQQLGRSGSVYPVHGHVHTLRVKK